MLSGRAMGDEATCIYVFVSNLSIYDARGLEKYHSI